MKRLFTPFALAAAMTSAPALAQNAGGTMDVGLSMLKLAASKEFSHPGVDVDPMSLSLNQLATIKSVIGSSDYNDSEKKRQIEAIIASN